MTSQKKYLVIPGNIRSRNDRGIHYISANQLMQLYGVNPRECLIYDDKRALFDRITGDHQNKEIFDGLIKLTPRVDGNYRLT